MEKTLALIKPDAMAAGHAGSIKCDLEQNGFTIISSKQVHLTPRRAEQFYVEHRDRPFFAKLVEFMCSGPVVAMILGKENAILEWRALMGPTNSVDAKMRQPKSLRARYGTDGTRNACHGSDSKASASREIKAFFPRALVAVPSSNSSKEYLVEQLQPTLIRGLAALCKERPTEDPLEAVSWLSKWLENYNKNRARTHGKIEEGTEALEALFAEHLTLADTVREEPAGAQPEPQIAQCDEQNVVLTTLEPLDLSVGQPAAQASDSTSSADPISTFGQP
mmetsp:Transcript_25675/g.55782  ORF Transcript_25675/g.55782 Transcript_25675/m.55782 type:complete len:278 (-) Transcript_25675:33-866(-)